MACAQFCSGCAVQLLQAGAREALGHEFQDVSAVTIHQPVAHLDCSPLNHFKVGVFSGYLKQGRHQQIAASFRRHRWNQISPSLMESRTKAFRRNRSSKSIARERSLSSARTSRKITNDLKHNSTSLVQSKRLAPSKNPKPAMWFMKETAEPPRGNGGRASSVCSQEETMALLTHCRVGPLAPTAI